MKIKISYDKELLWRLVVNRIKESGASLPAESLFPQSLSAAAATVGEILLPVAAEEYEITGSVLCFTLSPIGKTTPKRLAQLIERAIVTVITAEWCSVSPETEMAELKHAVLGAGVQFKRKNEK